MGGSYSLALSPVNQASVAQFAELLMIFGDYENGTITVRPEHAMTESLREKINQYCELYKNNYPILNRFQKTISGIPDEEFFIILPNHTSDNKETILLYNYLHALNSTSNQDELVDAYNNANSLHLGIFGDLLDDYHITTEITHKRTYIGVSDRKKRVCRFCHKTMNDGVTFKNVAHAIPEALGNKNLVLYEECDECNGKFGRTVEQDFITYFNFYRVFWATPGKNGVPKIKFKNGYIERVDDKFNIGYAPGQIEGNNEIPKAITLIANEEIASVNIYKALCKIAISVLDTEKLRYFEKTIDWIHRTNDENTRRLPKVAILNAPGMDVDSPQIILYLRKSSESSDLPHVVGEFKFRSLIFVFIVPFSVLDAKSFASDESYNTFWQSFPHYRSVSGWRFEHFDSPSKKGFSLTLALNDRMRLKKYES